jgi:hypothetical protein
MSLAIGQLGLNGGVYLSGSIQTVITGSGGSQVGFQFVPLSASIATLSIANITNGNAIVNTNTNPIQGLITSVTQSSGTSIVYFGVDNFTGNS